MFLTIGQPRKRNKMKKSEKLVPVECVPEHGFFRKKTGAFVYKVISESSAEYLKLSSKYVYGVTHNGNVSSVKKGTLVVPVTVADFMRIYEEGAEEDVSCDLRCMSCQNTNCFRWQDPSY